MSNMKILIIIFLKLLLLSSCSNSDDHKSPTDPAKPDLENKDGWTLVWNDEFDGTNSSLEDKWISANGPSSHILSSRYRENAVVSDGTLKLLYKKEKKGGKDWTSGSIWTKERFRYGYFEARYKYAAAEGTNNSFWLWTSNKNPPEGKQFEIDINEGHYPSTINTNIHNLTVNDASGSHIRYPEPFYYGLRPDINIKLKKPIKTKRI